MISRPDAAMLPLTPGVYLYKDAAGRVIYVGKARILRRRILSYFRETGVPAKTRAMLEHAASVETFSTTTEKEALLLEAGLIKKHRPHYNIVLRDDKQYALFRLSPRQPFPRLEMVRTARRDGARYFGPFTAATDARATWKLLHRVFPLRRCTDRAMKNRTRPCLYHHLGQCLAPCMGLVSQEEYQSVVRRVTDLLSGRSAELLRELRKEMEAAAEALDFERAAVVRDQLRAVEHTLEKQAAVLPGGGDLDVVGLYVAEGGLGLGIIFVRGGALTDGRTFFWSGLGFEDAPDLLRTFPFQFYGAILPPPRLILPWLPEDEPDDSCRDPGAGQSVAESGACAPLASLQAGDADLSMREERGLCISPAVDRASADAAPDTTVALPLCPEAAGHPGQGFILTLEQTLTELRGGSVRVTPPRSPEENRLVDMAIANAREETLRRRQERPVVELLAEALHLAVVPRRIECVDVSHTGGQQTRVGLVVFEDGKPLRSAWREYAVADGGGDDTGVLAAWIPRRLESGPPWPDMLLIDGGRGQLHAVCRALREAGKEGFFACVGIAKARDEAGRADRRAGNIADRIFLPGRSNPLPLRAGAPEVLFLQYIRDTTHNFAIGRHRRARTAAALTGEILRLPGIGPHTARLLWDHFGSVEAMTEASREALAALPGIGPRRAALLRERLQGLRK